jgi:hypothetical protein
MSFGFGIWLAFYMALAFLIGRLYASFVGWKFVRVAFAPGVATAGLARMLACILTGNDAKKSDCWRREGPAGSAGAPGGSTGFRLLFAVAPFLLAIVGVLLADYVLGHPLDFDTQLPQLSTTPSKAGETFFGTAADFCSGITKAVLNQRLGNAPLWLFLYLATSFVVGAAPSLDDLKSIAVACGVLLLASMGLEFFGVEIIVNHLYGGTFWRGFSLLVAYAIFVLVVSAVMLLPLKLLRDSRKEKK